ncbi:MAG: LacI family DNA-binding transcriptional regulator [Actinobacteria bacterium]|nr:LacI family DNA-binding transcriptional regulator [Actinomycetota bacterium]
MAFTAVTLRDVAKHAGVHPGTASRALNSRTRALVNEATAKKVLEAARELGYRPNPIARGLKTNRSETIGVLIPDLTNPLFPPIVRGIEDRLREEGYTALLANSDNDPTKERLLFETMSDRQVEGFILATADREDPLVEDALAARVPIVMVNRTIETAIAFAVVGRDRGGSQLAVSHLVGLGHTRIGHIGGPERFSTGKARYEGFVAAMEGAGLEADRRLIGFGEAFTEDEGARVCRELLAADNSMTAIVAGNDLLALGCYDVFAEEGLRCPENISVIGYNDMPFIDKLRPPLSTIRIPHYEIGWNAADLLLLRISDPDASPRTVFLEPELVVRASTGPPPQPLSGTARSAAAGSAT